MAAIKEYIDKKWYSIAEAAAYTSLSKASIENLLKDVKITHRKLNKRIVIPRDALDKYIERNSDLFTSVDEPVISRKKQTKLV